MKNKIKKSIAVVLTICLLISYSGNAFAALAQGVTELGENILNSLSNGSSYYTDGDGYNTDGDGVHTDGNGVHTDGDGYYTDGDGSYYIYLESEHPYENYCDKTWEYTHPVDADSLMITFSDDTETESGYDYIYILDTDDNQIGEYSGTELAGKSIVVPGNSFTIRLTSDGSFTYNGFKVVRIESHTHSFDGENDYICDCGLIKEHDCVYDNDCDESCNLCDEYREAIHTYDNYLDATCNECGFVREIAYLESEHPYENNCDETWEYIHPVDADSLIITFSDDTETESGYDYIYILDANDNQIGKYSGTELAGKSIVVPGNSFTIRLTSDGSVTYNGFKVVRIESHTHSFDGENDYICDCGLIKEHDCVYDNDCDESCNLCDEYREAPHQYSFHLDTVCNNCGASRSIYGIEFYYNNLEYRVELSSFDEVNNKHNYTLTVIGYEEEFKGVINIPESVYSFPVTSIGSSAFSSCMSFVSVMIPEGLISIGSNAFSGCDGLISVTIPNGVTSIGEGAFANCSNLENIKLAKSVIEIGDFAFFFCDKLDDVWYSGSKEDKNNVSIGYDNGWLWNSTWHYNTCDINEHIYDDENDLICNNCEWFKKHEHIYDDVFDRGCNLCTHNREIIGNTFYYENLKYSICNGPVDEPERLRIVGYKTKPKGELVFSESILGHIVEDIAAGAFKNCTELTSVTIPDGWVLHNEAFSGCVNLKELTLKGGLSAVYTDAFKDCKLEDIYILDFSKWCQGNYGYWEGTTGIWGGTWFVPCNPLKYAKRLYVEGNLATNITIPSDVSEIKDGLFSGCTCITGVVIPNSVKSIGDDAFSGCSSLTSVTIGNGVTSIGDRVFQYCSKLTNVNIGNSVTNIEYDAFAGCIELKSISIPEGVTRIAWGAFSGCTSLASISIPNSVTDIVGAAFSGCSGLENITVSKGNTVYHSKDNCIIETQSNSLIVGCKNSVIPDYVTGVGNYAFSGRTDLASIILSDNITAIGYSAFQDCTSLTHIILPNSLEGVYSETFNRCTSLITITIPDGVEFIENDAFSSCTELRNVIISNDDTYVSSYAFDGCVSLTDVWYIGSESDKDNMYIGEYNDYLINATWHYNYCAESDTKEHAYTDDYDTDCNECGYIREVPSKIVIGGKGENEESIEVVVGEVLPVLEKVGTKFVLGWINSLGETVEVYNGEEDLVAEYVETLMMTVKYQLSDGTTAESDSTSIRFIASVDGLERYNKVGWVFSLTNTDPMINGAGVAQRESNLVYKSVLAAGKELTAADIYGTDYSEYLYVFTITDVPAAAFDSNIYVRAYVEMNDGTIVYGDVTTVKVSEKF